MSPALGRRGGSLRHAATVRPDISFVSKKTAIFVHGCYWHRCQLKRLIPSPERAAENSPG
ncbi:MAG: hypothetical protein AB7Q37_00550 [Pyrinomonadaceae bacterium]